MSKKIEQIECYITNLETIVSRNSRLASDEEKKQMETIANKTIAVLKETINRTLAVRSQIANDEEYDKFVDRVAEKTAKVYRATLDKLSLVSNQRPKVQETKIETKEEVKETVETLETENTETSEANETNEAVKTEASFSKITENENVRPAAKMAKTLKEITDNYADEDKLSSKVISIIDSKKTKDVVNRLSLTALNVADKGLDVLIKLLDKGIKCKNKS